MTTQYRSQNNVLDQAGRYEVGMLDDRISPSGTMIDAFGRLRISDAFSLFTSAHIYDQNDRWTSANTSATSNSQYDQLSSSILMNVGTATNDQVIRESKKVMFYQPGKSLLVMNTFTFDSPKTGLRQRVGYFNSNNGIYLEQSNSDIYLVTRSETSGSFSETRVPQSEWNVDTFDGTKYSAQLSAYDVKASANDALDLTKSQIFWMDIEWLGIGDVRCGFVVDGIPKIAHIFHHENEVDKPYIQSASLPLRSEITNIATTASASTMRHICSSVVSEGGFSPDKKSPSYAVGRNINQPYNLATAGTFYNVVTISLRTDRPHAVVIPEAFDLLGTSNARYQWKVIKNATFGTALTYANTTSRSVRSSITNTTVTGGRVLDSGFISTGGQIQLQEVNLYEQLDRVFSDSTGDNYTMSTYTIAVSPASNQSDIVGQIRFLEVI